MVTFVLLPKKKATSVWGLKRHMTAHNLPAFFLLPKKLFFFFRKRSHMTAHNLPPTSARFIMFYAALLQPFSAHLLFEHWSWAEALCNHTHISQNASEGICPNRVQKVPAGRTSFLRLQRLQFLPCGKMARRCSQTLAKASNTLQSHPHFAKRKCACALTKSKIGN